MATPYDGFLVYQLKRFKELKVLTSLFIDPHNPDDFVAGFITAVTPRQVMLRSVSPFGRYDGFIVVRLCDIAQVMGEDDYAMRLAHLLKARGEDEHTRSLGEIEIGESEDMVHALCRTAHENDLFVTLWLHDDIEHIGRVQYLDDMRVIIGEVDYFGQHPQPVAMPLREIEMASVGSEDDMMYQLLSEHPIK